MKDRVECKAHLSIFFSSALFLHLHQLNSTTGEVSMGDFQSEFKPFFFLKEEEK